MTRTWYGCAGIALWGMVGVGDALAEPLNFELLYEFHSSGFNQEFGQAVSGAGDVNNDGYDDFIIGSPRYELDGVRTGAAFVYSGLDGSTLFSLHDDEAFSDFGNAVTALGDLNNDGHADFAVASKLADVNGFDTGRVRVFSGADGSTLFTAAGDDRNQHFGSAISNAGDINRDGVPDLIVGAPKVNNGQINNGRAQILSGSDGSVIRTMDGSNYDARFGFDVAGAGDFNNDGFDDVIIGENGRSYGGFESGAAHVISGENGEVLRIFGDQQTRAGFGSSVSGAGDLNGDGFDDVIVGVPSSDDAAPGAGKAVVLSGQDGTEIYTIYGDNPFDYLGIDVASVGDVNGDNVPDMLFGAWGGDGTIVNSGTAHLYSGIDGVWLATFEGISRNADFGISVSGIGDINGDGNGDFMIGSQYGGDNNGGYVRVFAGVPTPGGAVLAALSGIWFARRRR